jgi:beta-fructofuranosidase
MQFHAERAGILDYGSYYAPKTQLDKSGRRILWGWIQEARPLEQYRAAGWAGMISLPRVLALDASGKLESSVAPEARRLRGRVDSVKIGADEESNRRQIEALRIEGCCGEVECIVRRTSDNFGIILSGSAANASPWLTIQFDSQRPTEISIDARPIPLELGDDEDFKLEFYIDGSVIEAFVNNQVAYTKRFYYPGGTPQDMRLKWTGKTTNLISLSVCQLMPISPNRLTRRGSR